ncbi:MAG: tetratricopeptide repeat protein [Myxococcales bacterium]|nr:MAG: tetratricopeptide repeat protein [Myxococcales bacterium]
MKGEAHQPNLMELRKRAEGMLAKSCERSKVEPVLQRIAEHANEGSDLSLFAYRNLAELWLEENPWKAALYLRRVLKTTSNDDVAHALLGLCQTLLGNYGAAVAAYRRALQVAPKNPWYHHNLGHLLDVALGASFEAVSHLRKAHEHAPTEHEITASLAHCLAGLGELDEAQALAQLALDAAPSNRGHRELALWIDEGAPQPQGPHELFDSAPAFSASRRGAGFSELPSPIREDDGEEKATYGQSKYTRSSQVLDVLAQEMEQAGLPQDMFHSAVALWNDYKESKSVRVNKPEAYAAAVEYAIVLVNKIDGVTRSSVAKRYGVNANTVSTRYNDIRDQLALQPGDPRYARCV